MLYSKRLQQLNTERKKEAAVASVLVSGSLHSLSASIFLSSFVNAVLCFLFPFSSDLSRWNGQMSSTLLNNRNPGSFRALAREQATPRFAWSLRLSVGCWEFCLNRLANRRWDKILNIQQTNLTIQEPWLFCSESGTQHAKTRRHKNAGCWEFCC